MAARKPKKTLTSKPNVIKKNTGTKKVPPKNPIINIYISMKSFNDLNIADTNISTEWTDDIDINEKIYIYREN